MKTISFYVGQKKCADTQIPNRMMQRLERIAKHDGMTVANWLEREIAADARAGFPVMRKAAEKTKAANSGSIAALWQGVGDNAPQQAAQHGGRAV